MMRRLTHALMPASLMLASLMLASLMLAGCSGSSKEPTEEKPGAKAAAAAASDAGTRPRRRRRPSIEMAAVAHDPKPAGEPGAPEDFNQLSKAAETGAPVKKAGAPPIQRLDDNRVRIGRVEVDRNKLAVRVPARLNQAEGILEYVAVSTNGKLHESILELFAEPSHIHLALILVGLEPNSYVEDPEVGRKVVKQGGRVNLFVEWQDPRDGKLHRKPAEYWLYNRKTQASPPTRSWSFIGSFFYNGRYAADADRSVVALVPDGTALVGNVNDDGNPYRGDGLGFEVFTKHVPPIGTPVAFVLEAANPEALRKKQAAGNPAGGGQPDPALAPDDPAQPPAPPPAPPAP